MTSYLEEIKIAAKKHKLLQWRKVIIHITFLITFVTGCIGEADSTPTASISAEREFRQTTPSTALSPTSNVAMSAASDVITASSPTAQPIVLTSTRTMSDTINFASPTSTQVPTPPPTISLVLPTPIVDLDPLPQPTSFLESPLITPPPTKSPTPQPQELTQTPAAFVSPLESPSPTTTANAVLSVLEKEMFDAINAERVEHDLPPYQADRQLAALAQTHAQDMARRGYMSHTTPEGKTYTDRLAEIGITPQWRGENIVLSVSSEEEAVQDALAWWFNSAPHRRNVLHPQHSHLGVGVAQTPEGWHVFVLNLIKRD